MRFLKRFKEKKRKVVVFLAFAMVILAPANAATINWTSISDIISGAASIFPSFITLVTNAVPVILVMAVVTFVVGFFDSILDAVRGFSRLR